MPLRERFHCYLDGIQDHRERGLPFLHVLAGQLWEIDENLMRAELGPSEMAEHLKRRKEIWDKRQKKVGEVRSPSGQKKGFAKDTEDKTGTSKRTTNQAVSRATAIPADVLARIQGTELDKGTYLDKLKALSHE